MTEPHMVPTRPSESAGFIASGAFLVLAGFVALLGAVVASLSRTAYSDGSMTTLLVWVGVAAALVGAAVLSVGLYRIAAHADRAAGVRFPAAPDPSRLTASN